MRSPSSSRRRSAPRCRRSPACRPTSSRSPRRRRPARSRRAGAALVRRIVREATGSEPRELRFLNTTHGLVAFLTLGLDGHEPAGRGAPARQRDRGAHPSRAAGHRRRDSSYGAVKLCMFTPRELALERGWPGRIEGDKVIQLAAQTLQSFFTGGGSAREHAEYALADVDLRPPVLHPPAVRDFMAFEEHVATARRQRGSEVPKEWYEIPVFYFSNPTAIFGPEDAVPYPEGTQELDYELECAAVIGANGDDRRLHRPERLVGARPAAPGDARRARAGEGKGLRHVARPRARDSGRVRRQRRCDGRARERRGTLARRPERDVPPLGRAARAAPPRTPCSSPGT